MLRTLFIICILITLMWYRNLWFLLGFIVSTLSGLKRSIH